MRENIREYIIYGGGGFAREIAWQVQAGREDGETKPRVVCYADDAWPEAPGTLHDIPIMRGDEALVRFPDAAIVVAIGNPEARKTVTERVLALGRSVPTIMAASALCGPRVVLGMGSVICEQSILTTDIAVGIGVQINLHCTIGHDVVLGDYVTLAPGVHISGNVHIEPGVYIGTGAVVINGHPVKPLRIGAGAVIGAQACVIRDVPVQCTVVGVPAQPK